jgi:hypothetical protein
MRCRIVDQQRNVFAGSLAGALPARANLRAFVIAVMDAVVGRVVDIGRFGRDDTDLAIDCESMDASDEAGLFAGKSADLWHGETPRRWVGKRPESTTLAEEKAVSASARAR